MLILKKWREVKKRLDETDARNKADDTEQAEFEALMLLGDGLARFFDDVHAIRRLNEERRP